MKSPAQYDSLDAGLFGNATDFMVQKSRTTEKSTHRNADRRPRLLATSGSGHHIRLWPSAQGWTARISSGALLWSHGHFYTLRRAGIAAVSVARRDVLFFLSRGWIPTSFLTDHCSSYSAASFSILGRGRCITRLVHIAAEGLCPDNLAPFASNVVVQNLYLPDVRYCFVAL